WKFLALRLIRVLLALERCCSFVTVNLFAAERESTDLNVVGIWRPLRLEIKVFVNLTCRLDLVILETFSKIRESKIRRSPSNRTMDSSKFVFWNSVYLELPVTGMGVLLIVLLAVKTRSSAVFPVGEMPEY
ncbi:hypothetical protein Golob_020936, partial [Gossypium lobatum]|nr:hypothetical protein [Gossypium lobatum]